MSLTLKLSGKDSVLRAKFSPPIELEQDSQICLLSLIFWNSIPNVNSTNQNFYYNNGEKDVVVTIPTGCYEIENIQDYLRDYMKQDHRKKPLKDEEKLLLNDQSLILFGNRQTLKSEVICRYPIDFSKPNNIGKLLGFGEKIIPAFSRVESEGKANILDIEVIKVLCNISESSYESNKLSHAVHEFFYKVPPGFKIIEIPENLIYYNLNTRIISELEIKIVDQNDNLLNLGDENIHVRFHIRPNANFDK